MDEMKANENHKKRVRARTRLLGVQGRAAGLCVTVASGYPTDREVLNPQDYFVDTVSPHNIGPLQALDLDLHLQQISLPDPTNMFKRPNIACCYGISSTVFREYGKHWLWLSVNSARGTRPCALCSNRCARRSEHHYIVRYYVSRLKSLHVSH